MDANEAPIQRTLTHSDTMDEIEAIKEADPAGAHDKIYQVNGNFNFAKGREIVELKNTKPENANLVTSVVESDFNNELIKKGKEFQGNKFKAITRCINHAPVIDFDIPIKLIPSSQIGHYHLYIEKEIPWHKYQKLLDALADADLIERGYYNAARYRGFSAVRPSGSYKKSVPKNIEDVQNENAELREKIHELTVERNSLAKKIGTPPQDSVPKAKVLTANA